MDALNSCARIFAQPQVVIGTCTVTTGTPSLTQLSGESLSDQAQVSVADTGTGKFTISVQNFRGPNGYITGNATAIAPAAEDYTVTLFSQSYTANTDTANFIFSTATAGTVADGASFNFTLWAF